MQSSADQGISTDMICLYGHYSHSYAFLFPCVLCSSHHAVYVSLFKFLSLIINKSFNGAKPRVKMN